MTDNPHIRIEAFDSTDEMFDFMAKNEAAANERTTDAQRAIGWGDYFVRVWPHGPEALVIFGRIPTRDEFVASESALSDDAEELAEIISTYDGTYERGYRFAWCYSEIEPAGECGDSHISTMTKITKAQFDYAETCQWDPTRIDRDAWERAGHLGSAARHATSGHDVNTCPECKRLGL